MKVINTEQLVILNETAQRLNYNRQLDHEDLGIMVDPDGLHVLDMVMIHEHAQGKAVDPHYRCILLIKCKGKDEPYQAFLDVEADTYNKLPGTKDAAVLQTEFVKNWNATLADR